MMMHLRLAVVAFLGIPMLAGANIEPLSASAFVMGAWAGVILAGPPLMLLLFCLGIYNLRQLLAPLLRLPVLIVLTLIALYLSGVELGLGLQGVGAAVMLWWARKGRHLLGL